MAQDVAFLLVFDHLISKFVMPPAVCLSVSVGLRLIEFTSSAEAWTS